MVFCFAKLSLSGSIAGVKFIITTPLRSTVGVLAPSFCFPRFLQFLIYSHWTSTDIKLQDFQTPLMGELLEVLMYFLTEFKRAIYIYFHFAFNTS